MTVQNAAADLRIYLMENGGGSGTGGPGSAPEVDDLLAEWLKEDPENNHLEFQYNGETYYLKWDPTENDGQGAFVVDGADGVRYDSDVEVDLEGTENDVGSTVNGFFKARGLPGSGGEAVYIGNDPNDPSKILVIEADHRLSNDATGLSTLLADPDRSVALSATLGGVAVAAFDTVTVDEQLSREELAAAGLTETEIEYLLSTYGNGDGLDASELQAAIAAEDITINQTTGAIELTEQGKESAYTAGANRAISTHGSVTAPGTAAPAALNEGDLEAAGVRDEAERDYLIDTYGDEDGNLDQAALEEAQRAGDITIDENGNITLTQQGKDNVETHEAAALLFDDAEAVIDAYDTHTGSYDPGGTNLPGTDDKLNDNELENAGVTNESERVYLLEEYGTDGVLDEEGLALAIANGDVDIVDGKIVLTEQGRQNAYAAGADRALNAHGETTSAGPTIDGDGLTDAGVEDQAERDFLLSQYDDEGDGLDAEELAQAQADGVITIDEDGNISLTDVGRVIADSPEGTIENAIELGLINPERDPETGQYTLTNFGKAFAQDINHNGEIGRPTLVQRLGLTGDEADFLLALYGSEEGHSQGFTPAELQQAIDDGLVTVDDEGNIVLTDLGRVVFNNSDSASYETAITDAVDAGLIEPVDPQDAESGYKLSKIGEAFAAFDENNDNVLDGDEFLEAVSDGTDPDIIDGLYNAINTDNQPGLSPEELKAAEEAGLITIDDEGNITITNLGKAFGRDPNQDLKLGEAALSELGVTDPDQQAFLMSFDTDDSDRWLNPADLALAEEQGFIIIEDDGSITFTELGRVAAQAGSVEEAVTQGLIEPDTENGGYKLTDAGRAIANQDDNLSGDLDSGEFDDAVVGGDSNGLDQTETENFFNIINTDSSDDLTAQEIQAAVDAGLITVDDEGNIHITDVGKAVEQAGSITEAVEAGLITEDTENGGYKLTDGGRAVLAHGRGSGDLSGAEFENGLENPEGVDAENLFDIIDGGDNGDGVLTGAEINAAVEAGLITVDEEGNIQVTDLGKVYANHDGNSTGLLNKEELGAALGGTVEGDELTDLYALIGGQDGATGISPAELQAAADAGLIVINDDGTIELTNLGEALLEGDLTIDNVGDFLADGTDAQAVLDLVGDGTSISAEDLLAGLEAGLIEINEDGEIEITALGQTFVNHDGDGSKGLDATEFDGAVLDGDANDLSESEVAELFDIINTDGGELSPEELQAAVDQGLITIDDEGNIHITDVGKAVQQSGSITEAENAGLIEPDPTNEGAYRLTDAGRAIIAHGRGSNELSQNEFDSAVTNLDGDEADALFDAINTDGGDLSAEEIQAAVDAGLITVDADGNIVATDVGKIVADAGSIEEAETLGLIEPDPDNPGQYRLTDVGRVVANAGDIDAALEEPPLIALEDGEYVLTEDGEDALSALNGEPVTQEEEVPPEDDVPDSDPSYTEAEKATLISKAGGQQSAYEKGLVDEHGNLTGLGKLFLLHDRQGDTDADFNGLMRYPNFQSALAGGNDQGLTEPQLQQLFRELTGGGDVLSVEDVERGIAEGWITVDEDGNIHVTEEAAAYLRGEGPRPVGDIPQSQVDALVANVGGHDAAFELGLINSDGTLTNIGALFIRHDQSNVNGGNSAANLNGKMWFANFQSALVGGNDQGLTPSEQYALYDEIAGENGVLEPDEVQDAIDAGWITVDEDGNIHITTEGADKARELA